MGSRRYKLYLIRLSIATLRNYCIQVLMYQVLMYLNSEFFVHPSNKSVIVSFYSIVVGLFVDNSGYRSRRYELMWPSPPTSVGKWSAAGFYPVKFFPFLVPMLFCIFGKVKVG